MSHKLSDEILAGYAAGSNPAAFDLVVASYLSLSDEARAAVAAYEAVGGAFLEATQPVPMADGALDRALAKIRASTPEPVGPGQPGGLLPEPLRSLMGGDLEAIEWQPLGHGVKHALIPAKGDALARLMAVQPGCALPERGKAGTEITLVLQGAYTSAQERFARGDIEVTKSGAVASISDGDSTCICLTANDSKENFDKMVGRYLEPIFGR